MKRSVLEGELSKDEPLGWLSHYRIDGTWIKTWFERAVQEMPSGRRVRITIEAVDE
jgi:hypothetical protein